MATLRVETQRLVDLADRDLARLWQLVANGASAETALRDLLPAIVEQYGELGAVMAAEWYDDARAKVGASRAFMAIPVEASNRGTQALVGWALNTATDDASLRSLILGGTQRRIADHVRDTVTGSAVADPAADGWQRVGDGSTCAFCSMLIGRGAVYSEASADFASHDKCGCSAVPAWSGQPRPVRPYVPSQRNITDADRARVREYLRTH